MWRSSLLLLLLWWFLPSGGTAIESCEVDPVDGLVELLAVGDGEVELLLGWLARAVGALKAKSV